MQRLHRLTEQTTMARAEITGNVSLSEKRGETEREHNDHCSSMSSGMKTQMWLFCVDPVMKD